MVLQTVMDQQSALCWFSVPQGECAFVLEHPVGACGGAIVVQLLSVTVCVTTG